MSALVFAEHENGSLRPSTLSAVTAAAQMSDQVVLLVFEAEVGVDRMRRLLGSDLRREYRLDRISARRTNIVEWKS